MRKVTHLLPTRAVTDGSTANVNGAYGIRTRDLLNAIEALYQLS